MKNILCFGDSNTYGLIPGSNMKRYNYEERWTGIIGQRFLKKGYRIIEEGLCGRTSVFNDPLREGRNGSLLLPVLLETHNPIDLVVLMLGTNDCKTYYDASAEVIGLGIKKLIHIIQKGQCNSKILIVSPIQLGEDIWNGYDVEFSEKSVNTSKKLSTVYEKIAREENVYFMSASQYAKPSREDREHLNKDGHKNIAKAIGDRIDKIMKVD